MDEHVSSFRTPDGVSLRVADSGPGGADGSGRADPTLLLVHGWSQDLRTWDRVVDDLRAAGVTEAHVVLPATVATTFARAALEAYAPLDPAALLITHADETDHLGPLVDVAVAEDAPLSYVASGDRLVPADPAALAAQLLP